MGNSPSKNQYVIQSTNKQSQSSEGQQQLQLSEESSNDTNDPDDSRPQPTKSKNISITKPRDSTITSTGYNTTTNGGAAHRRSPYYDLKIGMHIARQNPSNAVDSCASISSSSMSSTGSTSMSTCSSNISMKQLNTISPSGSYPSPANLVSLRENSITSGPVPEADSQKTTMGGCVLPTISEGGEHYKQEKQGKSRRPQRLSPATSSSKKSISNLRSSSPVILRRNSHDPYNSDKLNIDDAIEKLLHIGETRCYHAHDFPFHSWEVQLICAAARKVFLDQPSLLRLQAPIKIVGDVHGQFTDLLRILKLSGVPHDTNYLFLGDYVDRGKQSLETIMLLLCYKIKYPDRFFMLRGNHESANVTKMYGFYDECKRRMSTKTWKQFIDVFNTLPFAAIVQDKIFCVHGGISPQLTNMKQIEKIARPTDIPEEGLLTDLLWSDPDPAVSDWSLNDRGISYTFGKRNVYDFCSNFKYDLIIRGHMVVEDGYEFFARKKFVTVFSAPNYCGQFQNWGAVMSVTTGMMCSFELLKPHGMRDTRT